jgi:hypothetical protein
MSTLDPFAAFMKKVLCVDPRNRNLSDERRVSLSRLYEFALGDTRESCIVAMFEHLAGFWDLDE